jgi:predicted glycoside hydrolase/deacetylase ChbG (UPF0249 family)
MNQRIIVTADDYGMCDSVNQAIEECMAAGVVRAACVMMNMPSHRHTSSLRRRFPNCSIGIHWTLTEGQPVLPSTQVPSLVHPKGTFYSASELRRRWLAGRVNLAEIRMELRAQHERFCEVAGTPDFWNTHENFHVWPGLFSACVVVGRELLIPAMRSHRRFTVPRSQTEVEYYWCHPSYWLKGWAINQWSRRAEARGMMMPDGRVYAPGYDTDRESLKEVLRRLKWPLVKKALEFIIHPATQVEKTFGNLTESSVREYECCKNPELAAFINQQGIQPVNFEELRSN